MTQTPTHVTRTHRTGAILLWGLLAFFAVTSNGRTQNSIHLNQVGFVPGQPMLAVVTDDRATRFEVVRQGDGHVLFVGPLSQAEFWDPAKETTRIADFSKISIPGTAEADYRIRLDNGERSAPFKISNNVYAPLLAASAKAYYFNRASVALETDHAGQFARPAGHPDTAVYMHPGAISKQRPIGTVLSSPKGWYDAGDYNKYIVNAGVTVFTLLKALAHHPATFADLNLNIPESKNRIPDLLDEIRWQLDWMETMQDPFDGGVYHKLTTLRFTLKPGMPHSKYQKRYVVQKSTAATLNFAATMALCARVFSEYKTAFPGASSRYKKAAIRAWRWAQAHPDVRYEQPADVHTGGYAPKDETLRDEFLWAASELLLLTGDARYRRKVAMPAQLADPSWFNVGMLGAFSLVDSKKAPPALKRKAAAVILRSAEKLLDVHAASGYRVAMTSADFIWGSNAVALNKALVLLYAARLSDTGTPRYRATAQSLLDYVLGRNPTGYCFVTGFGARSPMHVHHRVSQYDNIDAPIPGFVVGGPQPGQQDSCRYDTKIPAKSYADDWCSYSTNEVAINWNAPLVYVLAALSE